MVISLYVYHEKRLHGFDFNMGFSPENFNVDVYYLVPLASHYDNKKISGPE